MWHTLLEFNTSTVDIIPTIVSLTDRLDITNWLDKQSVRPCLFRNFQLNDIIENSLRIDVDDEIWQKYQTK
jgi:hypothetical protein